MSSHVHCHAALVTAAVALVCACDSDDSSTGWNDLLNLNSADSWVAIEPTQCLTNPWEADWLAQHDDDYAAYPGDPNQPGLEPEEIAIIKDYYHRQGVEVLSAVTAPKYEVVCPACSCPEGHTMYLLVGEDDVDTMIGLGYRTESPPRLR